MDAYNIPSAAVSPASPAVYIGWSCPGLFPFVLACFSLFPLTEYYLIIQNHPKSVQRLPAERPAKYMPVFIM